MTPPSRSQKPNSKPPPEADPPPAGAAPAPGGRILAIDPGERRIGVAAADLRTRVAVPVTTIDIGGDAGDAGGDAIEAVVRLVREQDAQAVVVGLALSLSGALGPQAKQTQEFVNALVQRLDIPVHTWDERLTTAEALHRLPRPGGRPARGKRRPKGNLDAAAATIILQAFLDSQRGPATG